MTPGMSGCEEHVWCLPLQKHTLQSTSLEFMTCCLWPILGNTYNRMFTTGWLVSLPIPARNRQGQLQIPAHVCYNDSTLSLSNGTSVIGKNSVCHGHCSKLQSTVICN